MIRVAPEMHRTFGYFEEREPKVLENSARTSLKWSSLLVFLFEDSVSRELPHITLSVRERNVGEFCCQACTQTQFFVVSADGTRAMSTPICTSAHNCGTEMATLVSDLAAMTDDCAQSGLDTLAPGPLESRTVDWPLQWIEDRLDTRERNIGNARTGGFGGGGFRTADRNQFERVALREAPCWVLAARCSSCRLRNSINRIRQPTRYPEIHRQQETTSRDNNSPTLDAALSLEKWPNNVGNLVPLRSD